MQIAKPSEADRTWFATLVPDDPTVEVKPMFGNLGAFVNGNMFMGLFGPDVGIRLSEEDREEMRSEHGAGDFGPEGRPMKEYVAVPAAWRDDATRCEPWVRRALDHIAAMPPKRR